MVKIGIFFPHSQAAFSGNRNTATRWLSILKELGHDVFASTDFVNKEVELAVCMHALKTEKIARKLRERFPQTKLALVITGTDVRGTKENRDAALPRLEAADYILCLNRPTLRDLPPELANKTYLIPQSAAVAKSAAESVTSKFTVLVVGHLRHEKDPFRTAEASHLLPESSRVCVRHFGRALDAEYEVFARAEMRENKRYQWFGELEHEEVLKEIAASRLVVQSSRVDEAPSVVSEAIAAERPLLISNIPGLVGVLGEDYPGIFPLEDTEALAKLILRAEQDPQFYAQLKERSKELKPLLSREAEKKAWASFLEQII